MASFLRAQGIPVVDKGNQSVVAKLDESHLVVFYFSASWCPPCRQFTPLLKKFFETARGFGDQGLQIVFVSWDKSDMEFAQYMYQEHGDWWAVPFADAAAREKLKQKYTVSGIPFMAVINSWGNPVVGSAREDVMGAAMGSSTDVLRVLAKWRAAAGVVVNPPDLLPARTRVILFGLVGAAEHNGKVGVVQSYQAEKRRFVVEVDGDKQIALRPANLLQQLKVKLGDREGLVSGISDEGILVTIGDQATTCSEDSLLLPTGARARLSGLSKDEYNEKIVEIRYFDQKAGRYLVQLDASTQLSVLPNKMSLRLGL